MVLLFSLQRGQNWQSDIQYLQPEQRIDSLWRRHEALHLFQEEVPKNWAQVAARWRECPTQRVLAKVPNSV